MGLLSSSYCCVFVLLQWLVAVMILMMMLLLVRHSQAFIIQTQSVNVVRLCTVV